MSMLCTLQEGLKLIEEGMSMLCTLQAKSRQTRIGLLEEGSNLAITDLSGTREYRRAAREGGIKETFHRCVTEGDRSQPKP